MTVKSGKATNPLTADSTGDNGRRRRAALAVDAVAASGGPQGAPTSTDVQAAVARVFRQEGPRIRAVLVSKARDLTLVDDALSMAAVDALEQWGREGIPTAPGAWLTVVARRRVVDELRRQQRRRVDDDVILEDLVANDTHGNADGSADGGAHSIDDGSHTIVDVNQDDLALLFGSCHPILAEADRVALTLQAVGGLTAEEIARAFLVPTTTMEKRLARAKTKLRRHKVAFTMPVGDDLAERLEAVLRAIYLIFNEGYLASRGDAAIRLDLCDDALRLSLHLATALPAPEVLGLRALLLLSHARRSTRFDDEGRLVLLEHQDRTQWDREAIVEGTRLLDVAMARGRSGPYQIQAAIAALHGEASTSEATDWAQIAALYAGLLRFIPTPVVRLNHAVAVAMAHGVDAGLSLVERLGREKGLERYHLYWSTRAELMLRAGDVGAARRAFQRARNLANQPAERAFLADRLAALTTSKDALEFG